MIAPVINITPEALTTLNNASQIIQANPNEFSRAFKQTGIIGLLFVQKSYDAKASLGGKWKRLSPVTILLRRRGSGAKIKNYTDLAAKQAEPLKDTGMARRSLTYNASGNLFKTTPASVQFGSRINYLPQHDQGFTTTFIFDQAKKDLFKKNVQVKEPNPRKINPKQPGRKYKALVWSKFAWNMYKMLSDIDGKKRTVPARPIWNFAEMTSEQMMKLGQPLMDTIVRLIKRGK